MYIHITLHNSGKKDGFGIGYSQSIFNAELDAVFRFSLAHQVFD